MTREEAARWLTAGLQHTFLWPSDETKFDVNKIAEAFLALTAAPAAESESDDAPIGTRCCHCNAYVLSGQGAEFSCGCWVCCVEHWEAETGPENGPCSHKCKLPAAPAAEDALLRRPPLAVMLAVEVLCNHVEPGWENSKTIVRAWIDEERATRAALAGEK